MSNFLRIFTGVILYVLPSTLYAQPPSCDRMPSIFSVVTQLRGLTARHDVPCKVFTKEMAKSFIGKRFNEELIPHEVMLLEAFFKATNMIPKDYNLAKGLEELYLLQLGGFYDPKGKFFVMAGWQTLMPEEVVLSHELIHALQDQHFNLERFMDGKTITLDEELARQAVVEGDATLVMTDYMRQKAGLGLLGQESNVDSLALQTGIGASFEQRAPQALVKMLVFPYSSGVRFDHALMRSAGGKYGAIDLAFAHPPRSTREILHPEVFIRGEKAPELPIDTSEAKCHKDSIGEFLMGLMLYQNDIPSFSDIARELRADRVLLCNNQLRWKTLWSSKDSAKRFSAALQKDQKLKVAVETKSDMVTLSFR